MTIIENMMDVEANRVDNGEYVGVGEVLIGIVTDAALGRVNSNEFVDVGEVLVGILDRQ